MVTRQRPRSTRLLVVVLVAVSLAVMTLDYKEGQDGPLAGLGRGALTMIVPMQRAVTTVTRPIWNFFSGLSHLSSLEAENQALKQQLRDDQAKIAAAAQAKLRDDALTQLLQLQQTFAPDSVAAVITGSSLSPVEWTAFLDAGSAKGIALNMPVVTGTAEGPILVGHIVEVASNASMVQFIIDRRSSVYGMLSSSQQAGLIVGQGGDDMKMSLVDTGTQVHGNEEVFTRGLCANGQPGLYPPDILIGKVSRTLPSTNAVQETVDVQPAADFSGLQYVLVLKSRTTCR